MNRTGELWKARNGSMREFTLCVIIGRNERFAAKAWLLKSLEDPEEIIFTIFETQIKSLEEDKYDASRLNWIMKV